MSLKDFMQGVAGSASTQTYVDDVFSTYLYTGAGGLGNIVNNGIELGNTNAWFSVKISGTAGTADIYSNTVDSSGNIYVLYSYTNATLYGVAKFSSTGTFQWEKLLSVSGTNTILTSIIVAPDGNIYITGGIISTSWRTCVIKLDTSGNTLLCNLSSRLATFGKGMVTDSSSNLYIATGGTYYDIILSKTNSSGVMQWHTVLTHPSVLNTLTTCSLDTSGNLIAGGCYDYASYVGSPQPILIKASPTGSILWQKLFTAYGAMRSIVTDSSNNIYCLTSNACLLKLDSSGAKIWEKTFNNNTGFNGGGLADPIVCLQIDTTNNDLYVLFPFSTYTGIIKLNSSGVIQWSLGFSHQNNSSGGCSLIFKNNLLYYGNSDTISVIDTTGNISGGTNVSAYFTDKIATTTTNNITISDLGGFTVSATGDYYSAVTLSNTTGTGTFTKDSIPLTIGKGGLVWFKARSVANPHVLLDTIRGTQNKLDSSSTAAQVNLVNGSAITAMSTGFFIDVTSSLYEAGTNFASWTFRKAAKFFDVVTYTGDGTSNKTVNHSLGVAPGMMIIKRTDSTGRWLVYHRSTGASSYLVMNTTAAAFTTSSSMWAATNPTTTQFTVGDIGDSNVSGATYVAYLYAHDTAADGIIQCGSFTSTGSVLSVNLGFEPQWLLFKSSSNPANWELFDSMRGFQVDRNGSTVELNPNLSAAEAAYGVVGPTATGFTFNNGGSGETYIYMAIRRPNKPPTTGTQVYNAWTGNTLNNTAVIPSGFTPDLVISKDGRATTTNFCVQDRLRGSNNSTGQRVLVTNATTAEVASSGRTDLTTLSNVYRYQSVITSLLGLAFKRAPGFFDVVCYTASATTVKSHSLTVAPELVIVKNRSQLSNWSVAHFIADKGLYLESNIASYGAASSTGISAPTSSNITLAYSAVNNIGDTYVAYLFATLAGISKVGSYTGNGGTQNIECGFAAGARFVLVKRADSTGDWYVWDTARGIVTGNDPHLSLNTTAAEVTTDDSIDPYSAGFTVNQLAATNINVTSATYIFLAIS